MFDTLSGERGWIDWLGIGLCAAALLALLGLGGYGMASGFVQSRSYVDASGWVAVGTGGLGICCALYLVLELGGRLDQRQVIGIVFLSGMMSILSVAKGVPAALTLASGRPASVDFVVTAYESGGKGCRAGGLVAANPGYEELHMCATGLGTRPPIGAALELSGVGSDLGILRQGVRVLR